MIIAESDDDIYTDELHVIYSYFEHESKPWPQ
jgi:hypothetical protein